MNQIVRPGSPVRIGASACPHDCPSTCALEVEVLDERTIGRIRGAEDNAYTAGVICAKVARYAERVASCRPVDAPAVAKRSQGIGGIFAGLVGRRARPGCGELPARRAAIRPAGGLALLLCRHDGARHARRHPSAAARQGLFRLLRDDLQQPGLERLRRRHRKNCRPRSARNGEIRSRRHLGHQCGQHAGQCDDARGPCPQGAPRQDRRRRRVYERHDGAGGSARAHSARHRRRARLCRHALPVPRRQGGLGLSRPLHRCPARARRAFAPARSRMGGRHHRLPGRDDRGVCPAGRRAQARLLPPRLRLHPLAQRRGQHARGELHSRRHRRLAPRRRRRVPQQRRDLPLEQDHDRRARPARPFRAPARSIAHRCGAVRGGGCARGRPAGRGDADPEHQPGIGRAGPGARQARFCARGSVRLRARAIHDRDRGDGRRRAAGDDVSRARRHLPGRWPSIYPCSGRS